MVKRVGFQVSEELWNKFESAIKGEFDNVSEFFRDCMKEKIKEKEV